ncbi:MAG: flagellar M-ring protein FliF [Balneolaceae bacterium]|nr:MAG: flagellar M-ring protein FliF [Balneolaceae bacterium]
MANLAQVFTEFFGPLSSAQRTMFVGLIAAILIFMGSLFYWALKPDYTMLFGSLNPETAQVIVEELDERGVPYKIENNGRAIFVPGSRVHELRMQLASVGLVQSDVKGYELFDENSLGMTDFMQQINKKRALEGELARSINSLNQVEFSRIHLVLPERSPFQQSTVQASASVILSLKSGQRLRQEQVEGITSLIAGSVEGLSADAVVVLDQAGNRLTDGIQAGSAVASGNMQMQLRQSMESYLTERAQTMLDRALGPGNSLLRVSVEHDFDRLVRESDLIDPDSRTIMSEERRTETTTDQSSQQVPIDEFTPVDQRGQTSVISDWQNESNVQTRNYEVNKTREIFEKSHGEISRISASVLLNHKQLIQQDENGEPILVYEPYSAEEVNEFREVVRVALGIQPARGDELTITQIQFYDPFTDTGMGIYGVQMTPWNEIIRWSIILVTFLVIIGLIMSIRKRMDLGESPFMVSASVNGNVKGTLTTGSVPVVSSEKPEDMTEEEYEDFIDKKLSGKAKKQLEQKAYVIEEIKDFVELKPIEAAQVVRAIISNEGEG